MSVLWTMEVVIQVLSAQILWDISRAHADRDIPEMDSFAQAI